MNDDLKLLLEFARKNSEDAFAALVARHVNLVYSVALRQARDTLTFIDEDISTIDDGHFLYSDTVNNWLNLPSWRHLNGDTLGFADGHIEYWNGAVRFRLRLIGPTVSI